MIFADVAIPVPLQDTYTYFIPDELIPTVNEGTLVNVGFGKKKIHVGVVVRLMIPNRRDLK